MVYKIMYTLKLLNYAQYLQVKQFENKIETPAIIFFNVQPSFLT